MSPQDAVGGAWGGKPRLSRLAVTGSLFLALIATALGAMVIGAGVTTASAAERTQSYAVSKAKKGPKARQAITVGWYLQYCRCVVSRDYMGPRHTSFEHYSHVRDCGGVFNDNCWTRVHERYSDGYEVYIRTLSGKGWVGATHSRHALLYPVCRIESLSAEKPDRGCYQAWGT